MFHIDILAVGKNKDAWVEGSVVHYSLLLKKYANLNVIYLSDIKNSKNMSEPEIKKAEALIIEKYCQFNYCISLSERGKIYDSIQFGSFLEKLMQKTGRAEFIIGGIYGLDDSILKRSKNILSLSPMTFSHQLVRPILMEQLFRAFSIIAGSAYHK
jgi:23S rRNA (pseudouridine1915-N3)-methyltransferase